MLALLSKKILTGVKIFMTTLQPQSAYYVVAANEQTLNHPSNLTLLLLPTSHILISPLVLSPLRTLAR